VALHSWSRKHKYRPFITLNLNDIRKFIVITSHIINSDFFNAITPKSGADCSRLPFVAIDFILSILGVVGRKQLGKRRLYSNQDTGWIIRDSIPEGKTFSSAKVQTGF
jgi:hypothetical protein